MVDFLGSYAALMDPRDAPNLWIYTPYRPRMVNFAYMNGWFYFYGT